LKAGEAEGLRRTLQSFAVANHDVRPVPRPWSMAAASASKQSRRVRVVVTCAVDQVLSALRPAVGFYGAAVSARAARRPALAMEPAAAARACLVLSSIAPD